MDNLESFSEAHDEIYKLIERYNYLDFKEALSQALFNAGYDNLALAIEKESNNE